MVIDVIEIFPSEYSTMTSNGREARIPSGFNAARPQCTGWPTRGGFVLCTEFPYVISFAPTRTAVRLKAGCSIVDSLVDNVHSTSFYAVGGLLRNNKIGPEDILRHVLGDLICDISLHVRFSSSPLRRHRKVTGDKDWAFDLTSNRTIDCSD